MATRIGKIVAYTEIHRVATDKPQVKSSARCVTDAMVTTRRVNAVSKKLYVMAVRSADISVQLAKPAVSRHLHRGERLTVSVATKHGKSQHTRSRRS